MVALGWVASIACIVGSLALAYLVLKHQWLKSLHVNAWVFAVLWIGGCVLYCALPCYAPQSDGRYAITLAKGVEKVDVSSQTTAATTATVSRVECQTDEGCGVSLLSAANRVTAAFFPSRGGFETTVSDNIGVDGMWGQLLYYLFHWLVVLYVALLVFSLFGRHLVDKYLRWKMRWSKGDRLEMCVFWGDPEPARLLAENLRSKEGRNRLGFVPKILFLLPGWLKHEGSARASILRLSDKGYVLDFVDGLPSDDDKYNVVGREFELEDEDVVGRRHFLLSENSAYNIGLARAIVEKRCGENGDYAKEKLDLYIRVENSASSNVLKDWADAKMRSVPSEVNIHIFRETEVMAEDFIQRYPILKQRAPDGTDGCGWLLEGDGDQGVAKTRSGKDGLDVLIVGFGSRGQELLNKMLENSQFLGGENKVIPTRFTIVDKCEVAGCCPAREIYRRRSPEIVEPPKESPFKVEFVDRVGDVAEVGFGQLDIKVSNYDRIVVCTGNDELNVQIGDIARREFIAQGVKLEPGRLFVQLQSNDVAERELDKYRSGWQGENGSEWEMTKDCPVQYFGMWKGIFTYDGIVDDDKYYGAQLLNWRYNYSDSKYDAMKPPPETIYQKNEDGSCALDNKGRRIVEVETVANKWRAASWFSKESSVASYRGMKNILALMGCGIDRIDSPKEDARGAFREVFADPKSEVWNRLAQDEHLRWMAFLRTHGISRWDLEMPSLDCVRDCLRANGVSNPVIKANVQDLIRKHAWLVPYVDLPMISRKIAIYNDDYATNCGLDPFIALGDELARKKNYAAQWNDMKFVQWIPALFSQLWEESNKDKQQKIVKVGD